MAKANLQFSASEREAIGEAVRLAETGSSGEIVPFLAAASDDYQAAPWRGAAVGSVLAGLAAALLHAWGGFWGVAFGWVALPPVLGAGLGLWVVRGWPALRRALVGEAILDREVRQRAAEAFLAEEVFKTRERTGILLFLSLFERRVVILADTGIHHAVPQAEWDRLARDLARGVGAGRAVPALLAAIGRCGELLREKRLEVRADDINELPDGLRLPEG